MGLDDDAVIVTHVGGVYTDAAAGRMRYVIACERLPLSVRRRLVLEHDDRRYSFGRALDPRRSGIPLVLDVLHLRCPQPGGAPAGRRSAHSAGRLITARRPKIHVSSPRTALRLCNWLTAPIPRHRCPTSTATSSTPLPV